MGNSQKKVSATPAEVRAARAFLFGRGVRPDEISPRLFANAAKELDVTFVKLLALISRLYSQGQSQQQFRLDVIANLATEG
jgi:hypothetical protein